MKVTYVDAADVPPPPAEQFTTDDDTRETLRDMKPGESVVVSPAPDESMRTVKSSFTRVSRKEKILLAVAEIDSGRAIKVTRLC